MSERPRLRPAIVIRAQSSREEQYVIVKDPDEQKYFKFEPWEQDVLEMLDGTRDLEELTAELAAMHPEREFDLQAMADYVEGLRGLNLLERGEQEQHLVMMDKLKELRRRRFYDAEASTLFQIRIPLFDPNRLLDRVIPWIRWVWSPAFVVPWIAIFVLVTGFLFYHWDLYWQGFFGLWNLPEKGLSDWVGFFAVMFGVSIFHELGHGFTCKRFGGEVHGIGIMIFYLQPAFYCTIDDSYLFQNRWHRIAAAFGGAYFEMMLCSVAMAAWLFTPAEWVLHSTALTLVFFTGLSILILNVNPLIKLDGYYVLMDLLDIPDLREDSFRYLGDWLKRQVLRLQVPVTPISRRRRRIYLTYGVLSLLYTMTVLAVVLTFLRRWLVGWFGPVGYLLLAGLIAFLMRHKAIAAARFLRHLWLDKREWLATWRGGAAAGGAVLLLVFLLFVPRTATRVDAAFVVEPGERMVLRAPFSGRVREMAVLEGDPVEAGDLVAILESPDLPEEWARASAERSGLLRAAAAARGARDAALARRRSAEAGGAEARGRAIEARLARGALTAPIPGVIATPHLENAIGRHLAEGEDLCVIDRLDRVRLAVTVPEGEIDEIRAGVPLRFRAAAHPFETRAASVLSVAPAAREPARSEADALDLVAREEVVRVLVEIENAELRLRSGMSGQVQFLTTPRSVAVKFGRRFLRWLGSVVW